MNVSELEGWKLDYWVEKAIGSHHRTTPEMMARMIQIFGEYSFRPFSSCWDEGGPLIERERIALNRIYDFDGNHVCWSGHVEMFTPVHGPTPLVAAMRAFVASKLGETVPDEDPGN